MENNYQKKPKSKFLKIRCPRCNNPQLVFGKASTIIKCNECNKLLVKPTGGKVKVKARITRVMSKGGALK